MGSPCQNRLQSLGVHQKAAWLPSTGSGDVMQTLTYSLDKTTSCLADTYACSARGALTEEWLDGETQVSKNHKETLPKPPFVLKFAAEAKDRQWLELRMLHLSAPGGGCQYGSYSNVLEVNRITNSMTKVGIGSWQLGSFQKIEPQLLMGSQKGRRKDSQLTSKVFEGPIEQQLF